MKVFILAAAIALPAVPSMAQHGGHDTTQEATSSGATGTVPAGMPAMGEANASAMEARGPQPATAADVTTLPNLSKREGWPSPTADDANYGFLLFDNFEYREGKQPGALRWDLFGWYGGDVRRVWFKSEGLQGIARAGGDQEVQLLYGQLVSPFFDFQAGLRYAHRSGEGPNRSRVYAAIGLQGLAPYRFELEPSLFVSQDGKVSVRAVATYDLLLTQRLILQPRVEASAALQQDRAFGVGSGLNETEIGARVRYEVRREFAPYLGLSWRQTYGGTKALLHGGDEPTSLVSLLAGIRMWF